MVGNSGSVRLPVTKKAGMDGGDWRVLFPAGFPRMILGYPSCILSDLRGQGRGVYPLILFLFFLAAGCEPGTEMLVIGGRTMGTTFEVKIVRPDRGTNARTLELEINRILEEVNRRMSTYLEDSEISRFNRNLSTDWMCISQEFWDVLNVSLQVGEWSNGAFDITISPLVNLWGFGPEGAFRRVPPEDSILARQALVDFRKIQLDSVKTAVRKLLPDMQCDLAGVAKGFGVDKVAEFLEGQGFKDFFVEIGGDVRAKGRNARGENWRVGLASPRVRSGVHKVIPLTDMAIATSGDYQNFFEQDGIRYSHTLDPKTGRPVSHGLASVSVLAENCTMADALATALNVLGPEKGMELAEQHQLPVYMLVRSGDGFDAHSTTAFTVLMLEGK